MSAQPDVNIIVYTDPSCKRCQGTKLFFNDRKIEYQNRSIEIEENVYDMWDKLKEIGLSMDKLIEMPVILVNSVVVYPITENGIIKNISLENFLYELDKFTRLGTPLPYSYSGQDYMQIYEGEKDKRITLEKLTGNYFVIVSSFVNKANAEAFLKKLIDENYKNASINLSKENLNRISIASFTDFKDLLFFMPKITEKYKDAWILFKDKAGNEVVVNNPDGTFAIVAGIFPEEEKANTLKNELIGKSYKDTKISKTDKFFRVIIADFQEYDQAIKYYKEHSKKINLMIILI